MDTPAIPPEQMEPTDAHDAAVARRRWVADVLPLATSLFVHVGVIAAGLAVYRVVATAVPDAAREQVIVPAMDFASRTPNPGLRHVGPPVDPAADARQALLKTDSKAGFAASMATAAPAMPFAVGSASATPRGFGPTTNGGPTAPWGPPVNGGGGGAFLNIPICGANANDVVFLCDASGSMVSVFGQLKQELKRSISQMSVDENGAMKFNVIFFSDGVPTALFADGPHIATPAAKAAATAFIDDQISAGGTNPTPAIRLAMAQHADLVFVLTDGFDQVADLNGVVAEFARGNPAGRTHVNCIYLQSGDDPKLVAALKRIADVGHGQFKAILKRDM